MRMRHLNPPNSSFFLFGPRGVGKTTWLKDQFKSAIYLDLLDSKNFLNFSRNPDLFMAQLTQLKKNQWVVIDEIQKLPDLLDQVHKLIEEKELRFALTGSSARKLKRGGANLLAGRAVTRAMFPLTSSEWPHEFDLQRALAWGGLPLSVNAKNPADFLQSYFYTYIKEEIQEESLVRKIDPFIRFLEVAGMLNGDVLNIENISRETGSKRVTLDNWFSILEDTLIGFRLPGWRPQIKVRESSHPKFYWFDPGVARAAAGLLQDKVDSLWLGRALETWILHEVRSYNAYSLQNRKLFYYQLPSDLEVDLIIETKKSLNGQLAEVIAIEIKHSKKWNRQWESAIRSLASTKKVTVKKMIGVYLGSETLNYQGFQVLPADKFLKQLHQGQIF